MNIKSVWALRRHVLYCVKISVMAVWWQLRNDTAWLHLYGQFLDTYAAFTKAQERATPEGYVYIVALRPHLKEIKGIAHLAGRFRDTLARGVEEPAPNRYGFAVRCAVSIYITQGLTLRLTYMLDDLDGELEQG